MTTSRPIMRTAMLVTLGVALLSPSSVMAHGDGLDGPAVRPAQKALASRNVDLVLIWVQEQDEEAIRQAFDQTPAVR